MKELFALGAYQSKTVHEEVQKEKSCVNTSHDRPALAPSSSSTDPAPAAATGPMPKAKAKAKASAEAVAQLGGSSEAESTDGEPPAKPGKERRTPFCCVPQNPDNSPP